MLTGPVSAGRSVTTITWSLEHLLGLRRATGATVNDLFLTAAAAGLRAVAQDVADDSATLLALVPRNIRATEDRRTVGNRTWSMLVELPMTEHGDAQLLDAVRTATAAAKASDRSSGNAGFTYDVALSNVALGRGHSVAGAAVQSYSAAAPLQGTNRLLAVALSYEDRFTVTFTADSAAFPDLGVVATATDAAMQRLRRAARSAS